MKYTFYTFFNIKSGYFINKDYTKKKSQWSWDNKHYYIFHNHMIYAFLNVEDKIPLMKDYNDFYHDILLPNRDIILIAPITDFGNTPIFTKAFKL